MASRDKALGWRGDVRALIGLDGALWVFTTHPEGRASAAWRIDADKVELAEATALPTGAAAATRDGDDAIVAGTDGRLYRVPLGGGEAKAFGAAIDPAPTALALLDGGRLAALSGAAVVVLDRRSGAVSARLELPAPGTALATSADGRRLVAGTAKGEVSVFGPADETPGAELLAGAREKLHDGPVTALTFEPERAVFLSTGVDRKLLRGHARGAIEPEDRAGRGMHDDAVVGFAHRGEGERHRLYTAAGDGALKTWMPGKKRSRTYKDGVPRPTALAPLTVRGRPHLAVSGDDGAIRVYLLDADGQIVDKALTLRDAYAAAREAFADRQPSARQKAIDTLAGYDDGPAVALLVDRAERDDDAELRVRAVEALGASQNPRALPPLQALLQNARDAVRLAALAGLRRQLGEADRRPMEWALASGRSDVGVAAVEALAALCGDDDQAYAQLVGALDHRDAEVRAAAFAALDRHHPDDRPTASLLALASSAADVRIAGLIRFFRRGQLELPRAASAVRRAGEDADADVRAVAFRVALLSRPTLAGALRALDRDLHRQLHAIERGEAGEETKLPKPKKIAPGAVGEADRRPLLEAMAARALSTCLAGAVGLARLGDGRAFGTLLQLSREPDEAVRVEACRALAELGDPRGIGRLRTMLHDGSASARDAAFDALAGLMAKAPLDAAAAGLMAPHEDVRRRALGHLVAAVKKKAPKSPDDPAAKLLLRALNDAAPGVRGEAFKATLNLGLFGGDDAPLRFALQSLAASVRREVLNEVMGEIAKPWAADLLLELFDDPDPGLRREAFDFALKRSKGRDVTPLARALGCPHPDLRLEATRTLARKGKGGEARALLIEALDDRDRAVRITAIEALEAAEAHDAVVAAMQSARADVRIRAAESRAIDGDPAALAPLLAQAATEKPEVEVAEWRDLTLRALRGLAALADPAAVDALAALLAADDAEIRARAAEALGWSVDPSAPAPLHAALRHGDGAVRLASALALARLGDPVGASIVFAAPKSSGSGRASRRRTARGRDTSPEEALLSSIFGADEATDDTPVPSPAEALEAAVALGADDALRAFLDHRDATLHRRALRVLLLQEMAERDGTPDRCIAALSSQHGRVRLAAADGLGRFADPAAFAAFVGEQVCDRGEGQKPWALDAAIVADLGRLLAHGAPRQKARAVALLAALEADEQVAFDRAWRRFEARFGADLEALRAADRHAGSPPPAAELDALVFGAYVGLSRMAGGSAEARVRQTALARLAERGAPLDALVPVLVPALGDGARDVRLQAFAALRGLGFEPTRLAAEALGTGRRDVAVLGLELLAEEAGDAGDAVLADVIADDTDGLAPEAARLLGARTTPAAAWIRALDARDPGARRAAVAHLAELADGDPAALDGLRGALGSRFAEVRFDAAVRLAHKGDGAAFAPLVESLRGDRQAEAIEALVRLGDPQTAAALLDRIEDDPAGTADVDRLLRAVGRLRDVGALDRVVAHLADPARRGAAFDVARQLVGYDQRVDVDLDDPDALAADDGRWLEAQHPRHHAAAAGLIGALFDLGETRLLHRLLDDNVRWSPDPAIDRALAPLAALADDRVRHGAVALLGWRLRFRDGDPAPLKAAVQHADPVTRFHAAESLALAGHRDGVEVLLTAIDLDERFDRRRAAVAALGVLGDPRALDPLLRLVADDEHALQEVAAEAIGRLAATDAADRIFALLSRLAKGDDGVAQHALIGLRWFGTVDAWRIVRDRAGDDDWRIRETVARQLGHHDDPDTRRVLGELLRADDDSDVAGAALASLRRLYGPESLEPDYLLAQSPHPWLDERLVDRLRAHGDPARLLALLPALDEDEGDEMRPLLVAALLAREPAPVDAAAGALDAADPQVRAVAARILGRGGSAEAHGDAVSRAAAAALDAWQSRRAEVDPSDTDDERLGSLAESARWLVWAAGRLGVGADPVLRALGLSGAPAVRLAAIDALSDGLGGSAALDALAAAVGADDAAVRAAAAAALARLAPERAAALAGPASDDRRSLTRLAAGNPGATPALREAAHRVHAQGVALPLLVARGDLEALAAAAADRALPEAARLGAIEALARLATAPAEEAIAAIARDDAEDEALRRAAWRARRRAARARARREAIREGGVR